VKLSEPLLICGVVPCSQGEMRVYLATSIPAKATAKGEMMFYCDIAFAPVCLIKPDVTE